MTRVYKDKWVWLFLAMGILTLLAALNAAENTKRIKASVDWMYSQMHAVQDKAVISEDDRETIHAQVRQLSEAVRRLEARSR